MFVFAFFRDRVFGSTVATEEDNTATTPDQDVLKCSPTPEDSIAEPPPAVRKRAPGKTKAKRKATAVPSVQPAYRNKARKSPQFALYLKRSKQCSEAAKRLVTLYDGLARDGKSAVDWLQDTDNDSVLAELLPIWTKDCDRHRVKAAPIPLEICIGERLFAFTNIRGTGGLIERVNITGDIHVRGEHRYKIEFENDRARTLYLAHLLDRAYAIYKKKVEDAWEDDSSAVANPDQGM